MAGIFRFPNAVSDIDKFIQTYRSLYNNFFPITLRGEYFNHKEASDFLAKNGLASSSGAIGTEAIRRSRRDDTSRDPLYNQHKMYSEIYRMLGWYEPGTKKTNFKIPEYGSYIAVNEEEDVVKKLFSLNLLHIVSPNPLTSVRGRNILRPFPLILKMLDSLDGYLSRDEMIISVLACQNDRNPSYIDEQTNLIKQLRQQSYEEIQKKMKKLMSDAHIKSNDVLPNYTRFPIAAMKWTGWAEGINSDSFYNNKNLKYLRQTPAGKEITRFVSDATDIRYEDISSYSEIEQAAFVVWSNIHQLEKATFNTEEYSDKIDYLQLTASEIFKKYKINNNTDLLFFGYQEAPRSILKKGDELIGE